MTDKHINTLCRDTGKHSWQKTTASNFRACQRKGCKAVQINKDGVWTDVSRSTKKQNDTSTHSV